LVRDRIFLNLLGLYTNVDRGFINEAFLFTRKVVLIV